MMLIIKGSLKGIWKLTGKSVGQHLAPDPEAEEKSCFDFVPRISLRRTMVETGVTKVTSYQTPILKPEVLKKNK